MKLILFQCSPLKDIIFIVKIFRGLLTPWRKIIIYFLCLKIIYHRKINFLIVNRYKYLNTIDNLTLLLINPKQLIIILLPPSNPVHKFTILCWYLNIFLSNNLKSLLESNFWGKFQVFLINISLNISWIQISNTFIPIDY